MSLIHQATSPHITGQANVGKVMRSVAYALVPGILALTWFFGWGHLINLVLATTTALLTEALILRVRRRPVKPVLADNSALVTGLLLAVSLPPYLPWWATVVGVSFAITFAKQLYGGTGYNPFNPAMAGYALLLVSFPVAMTTNWATPTPLLAEFPGFLDTLKIIFTGQDALTFDGLTMATPLDTYKLQVGASFAEQILAAPVFGPFTALGWEWVNLAFLAGGLWLLYQGIITWHIPVSMLASLTVMSLAFGWDADNFTPLRLHLLAGATQLGAFFIATDPVSAATSTRGKLVYGAGIGVLIFVIRTWGGYPDAVAFSVLLMNFAAPFIDYYSQPRTYGHDRANQRKESSSP